MTNTTVISGTIDHGTFYTYIDNAKHQPLDNIYAPVYSPPNPVYLRQTIPLPGLTGKGTRGGYYVIPKTITTFACYKLALRTREGKNGAYPFYIGSASVIEYPANAPEPERYGLPELSPQERNPGGDGTRGTGGNGNDLGFTTGDEYFVYLYRAYISEWYLFQNVELTFADYRKSYYADLIGGYFLDTRFNPEFAPAIVPTITEEVTIGYYRKNRLEPIVSYLKEYDLSSLDWVVYKINLVKGKINHLPIKDCMYGSLHVIDGSNQILGLISALPTPNNQYSYKYYLNGSIAGLFGEWNALDTTKDIILPPNFTQSSTYAITETARELNVIYANNDYWLNDQSVKTDINADRFPVISQQESFEWHLKPQSDGSFGNLIMNSLLLIELHAALNAGKWGNNSDDPTKPREDDLGWRIQRMNEVLGIRVGTDLEFDPVKEKSMVRKVVNSSQKLDPQKVGVNNFGSDGMVVKRINNRFKGKEEIVSDQCVIVQDLLQLIQEYQEQHNLAVGIQESSAIEIKEGKNRARFDNQLGLLVELFNLLTSANEMTRATLISSLVSQSQTNEIIAGLGLPSVTKTIPVSIDKKVTQLPYKGIAPHRSISQEVATCTANVGIVLGQLL